MDIVRIWDSGDVHKLDIYKIVNNARWPKVQSCVQPAKRFEKIDRASWMDNSTPHGDFVHSVKEGSCVFCRLSAVLDVYKHKT